MNGTQGSNDGLPLDKRPLKELICVSAQATNS